MAKEKVFVPTSFSSQVEAGEEAADSPSAAIQLIDTNGKVRKRYEPSSFTPSGWASVFTKALSNMQEGETFVGAPGAVVSGQEFSAAKSGKYFFNGTTIKANADHDWVISFTGSDVEVSDLYVDGGRLDGVTASSKRNEGIRVQASSSTAKSIFNHCWASNAPEGSTANNWYTSHPFVTLNSCGAKNPGRANLRDSTNYADGGVLKLNSFTSLIDDANATQDNLFLNVTARENGGSVEVNGGFFRSSVDTHVGCTIDPGGTSSQYLDLFVLHGVTIQQNGNSYARVKIDEVKEISIQDVTLVSPNGSDSDYAWNFGGVSSGETRYILKNIRSDGFINCDSPIDTIDIKNAHFGVNHTVNYGIQSQGAANKWRLENVHFDNVDFRGFDGEVTDISYKNLRFTVVGSLSDLYLNLAQNNVGSFFYGTGLQTTNNLDSGNVWNAAGDENRLRATGHTKGEFIYDETLANTGTAGDSHPSPPFSSFAGSPGDVIINKNYPDTTKTDTSGNPIYRWVWNDNTSSWVSESNVENSWQTRIVDVKGYGAAGDGLEDDSSYVTEALDDAISNGCTLYFPKGTYYCPSISEYQNSGDLSIEMDRDAIIKGDGTSATGNTFLRTQPGYDIRIKGGRFEDWFAVILLDGPGQDSLHLNDVEFDTCYRCINEVGGATFKQFSAKNCRFTNIDQYALLLRCTFDVAEISNCRFESFGTSAFNPTGHTGGSACIQLGDNGTEQQGTALIENCFMKDITTDGLSDTHGVLGFVHNMTVRNVYVENCNGSSSNVDDEAITIRAPFYMIEGCRVVDSSHGEGVIHAKGSTYDEDSTNGSFSGTMLNNVITESRSINLNAIRAIGGNVLVKGNHVHGSASGINIVDDDATVVDNELFCNNANVATCIGIQLTSVNNAIVSRNRMRIGHGSASNAWAVRPTASGSNIIIDGNIAELDASNRRLVDMTGSGTMDRITVVNNTADGVDFGIDADGTVTVTNLISKNNQWINLNPNGSALSDQPTAGLIGDFVDVRDMGAVGDGVSDDYNALQKALDSGLPIVLRNGDTYRVDHQLSYIGDVTIYGHGAVIESHTEDMMSITGDVIINNVVFNGGNSQVERLLQLLGTDATVLIRDCIFQNIDSDTFAQGVAVVGTSNKSVVIDNCRFDTIHALKNDTVGDTNGSARGIYIDSTTDVVTITNSRFEDINSVDIGGTTVSEDSDAIQIDGTVTLMNVEGCYFTDVGLRFIKANGTVDLTVRDCHGVSSWPNGTTGMQNFVNAFTGRLLVDHCTFSGGPSQYFVQAGSNTDGQLVVKNSRWTPDNYQEHVNSVDTSFMWANIPDISLTSCFTEKIHKILFTGASNIETIRLHDNDFTTYHRIVDIRDGVSAWITDNIFTLADSSGTCILLDDFSHLSARNNILDGWSTGWYFITHSGTFEGFEAFLTNNEHINVDDDINENGNSFDVIHQIGNSWQNDQEVVAETVSDLSSLMVANNTSVNLLGYNSIGDGGGQPLYYDETSTATIDGGFVFPGRGGSLSFDSGGNFNGTAGTGRYIALEQNVANALKFGVVPNDSSAAVESANAIAIDKMIAAAWHLYFPTVGTDTTDYYTDSGISLGSDYVIEGPDSRRRAAIRFDGSVTTAIELTGSFNNLIRNINIRGAAQQNTGIYLNGTDRAKLVNVSVDAFDTCVKLFNTTICGFENLHIASCDIGIHFDGASYNNSNYIYGGEISTCDEAGIYIKSAKELSIRDVTIQGNDTYGISHDTFSVFNVLIDRCWFETNSTSHINSTSVPIGWRITDCLFGGTTPTDGDIDLGDSKYSIVENCQFDNSVADGEAVIWGASSEGNRVIGGALTDGTKLTAEKVSDGGTDNVFTRNFLTINVKDYGATGDGTTDDSGAIQAGLDTGGVIVLPAGAYALESSLSAVANASMIFEPGAELKKTSGTSAMLTINVANFTLQDATFDLNSTSVEAITMSSSTSNVKLLGTTTIKDAATGGTNTSGGVIANSVSGLIADNIELFTIRQGAGAGLYRGIDLSTTTDVRIGRVYMDDGDIAVNISNSTDINIGNVTAKDITDNGVYITASTSKVSIDSAQILSCGEGIVLNSSETDSKTIIGDVFVSGASAYGITWRRGGGYIIGSALLVESPFSTSGSDDRDSLSVGYLKSTYIADSASRSVTIDSVSHLNIGTLDVEAKEPLGGYAIYLTDCDYTTLHSVNISGIRDAIEFTTNQSSDNELLNATSHGLSDGEIVYLSTTDTLPSGLSEKTEYYVVSATTNTFKVSLTSGGTAETFSDDGTGTHSAEPFLTEGLRLDATNVHNPNFVITNMASHKVKQDYSIQSSVSDRDNITIRTSESIFGNLTISRHKAPELQLKSLDTVISAGEVLGQITVYGSDSGNEGTVFKLTTEARNTAGIARTRIYNDAGTIVGEIPADSLNSGMTIVLPTSSSGLPSGSLWNDSGTIKVVP